MKNIIFALLALPILFASCRESETACDQGNGNIVISFSTAPMTRAFFDDTAEAELWEKTINTASIFVFDPSGNLVVRKNLTPAELSAGQTTFSVTRDVLGRECSFYAVANNTLDFAIENQSKLLSCLDTNISDYNGTTEEVMFGCARPEGFIMTGKTLKTVAQYGSTTYVSVRLKRSVAKIAFRYHIEDEFYSLFKGSSVRIDNVTIRNANLYTMMFEDSHLAGSTYQGYVHTQEPLGNGALFYVYPLPVQENEDKYVTLMLDGIFDKDGNFGTTDDQTSIQYQIPVEGSGKGEIRRNGYYRIETAIRGISGQDASALLTVSDWEFPYSQFIGVGN